MTLQQLIKKYRDMAGLSQPDLEVVTGLSQQTISKVETIGRIGPKSLKKIVTALKIPDAELRAALAGTPGAPDFQNAHIVEHKPHHRKIPVMGHAAGALPGNGHLIMGEQRALIPCPPDLANITDAYAVTVTGTSMIPRYLPGEILYVNPLREPYAGDYVVAQICDPASGELHGYVKRFERWDGNTLVLHQHNPDEPIRFDGQLVHAIHKIVGTST